MDLLVIEEFPMGKVEVALSHAFAVIRRKHEHRVVKEAERLNLLDQVSERLIEESDLTVILGDVICRITVIAQLLIPRNHARNGFRAAFFNWEGFLPEGRGIDEHGVKGSWRSIRTMRIIVVHPQEELLLVVSFEP